MALCKESWTLPRINANRSDFVTISNSRSPKLRNLRVSPYVLPCSIIFVPNKMIKHNEDKAIPVVRSRVWTQKINENALKWPLTNDFSPAGSPPPRWPKRSDSRASTLARDNSK
ncbi:hypothetical protein EVAR_72986_1 [Eumeta japonica]|uniref:Uncharacterized protein n=1 Tax=Eumeta variegata TaxID=151549 RepID=A0A4C1SZE2_EUMVA|nr:hypothetical protein EVAR_72986_1 [Eumeta japonica]